MDILTKIGDTVVAMSNWLWGPPLLILLGAGGLLLTIRFGFVQFRHRIHIFADVRKDVPENGRRNIIIFRMYCLSGCMRGGIQYHRSACCHSLWRAGSSGVDVDTGFCRMRYQTVRDSSGNKIQRKE